MNRFDLLVVIFLISSGCNEKYFEKKQHTIISNTLNASTCVKS